MFKTINKLENSFVIIGLTEPTRHTFGKQRFINGLPRSAHLALDFRGSVGTPIVSPLKGKVVLVGDYFYTGLTLILDHGYGLFSSYFILQLNHYLSWHIKLLIENITVQILVFVPMWEEMFVGVFLQSSSIVGHCSRVLLRTKFVLVATVVNPVGSGYLFRRIWIQLWKSSETISFSVWTVGVRSNIPLNM